MTEVYKKVEFRGDTRKVVREWPDDVRRTAGNEIFRVQTGKEPHDWKPFPDVGRRFSGDVSGDRGPMQFMYCTPSRRRHRGPRKRMLR